MESPGAAGLGGAQLSFRHGVGNDLSPLCQRGEGQTQGGERSQAQEVELDQAGLGAVVLVPLEDRAVVHGGPSHRADLSDRAAAQDHASGVDPQVAGQSQQLLRDIEDRLRDVVALPGQPSGAHRGPPLHLLGPGVLHAGGVAESSGRRQEALEEHLVPDGVDGCDAQGVADCGVGRRSSPLAQDARLCAELDDGVHDEEVAGESQGLDDLELVVEHLPGPRVLLRGSVAAGSALEGELTQPAGRSMSLRDIGIGEVRSDEGQVEGEVCGELGGQIDGVRTAAVEQSHVLGSPQPAADGGQMTAGAFQVGDQAG